MLEFADGLYGRAEYCSINPKIHLTLLEICCGLVSAPNVAMVEDPFGLPQIGLLSQIEAISDAMSQAHYLHLYSFSTLPASQRSLPSFFDLNGMETQSRVVLLADEPEGSSSSLVKPIQLREPAVFMALNVKGMKSRKTGFYGLVLPYLRGFYLVS